MNAPKTVPSTGLFVDIADIINYDFLQMYQRLLLFYNEYHKQVKFCGQFDNLAALKSAVPEATDGCYAYITEYADGVATGNWTLCNYINGTWVASTQTITAGAVALTQQIYNEGGGQCKTTQDIRIGVTVGNLTPSSYAGSKIPKGTSLDEILSKMLDKYVAPTMSISGETLKKCGTSVSSNTITITLNKGDAGDLKSLTVTSSGSDLTSKQESIDVSGAVWNSKTATFSYTRSNGTFFIPENSVVGNVTYSVEAVFDKTTSDTTAQKVAGSLPITVYHKYYAGIKDDQVDLNATYPISVSEMKSLVSSNSAPSLLKSSVSDKFFSTTNFKTMIFLFPKKISGSMSFGSGKQGTNSYTDLLTIEGGCKHGTFDTDADLYGHVKTYEWYVFSNSYGYGDNQDFTWTVNL